MTFIRPLGYNAEWYDNGYGSENFKQKIKDSQKQFNKKISLTIQINKVDDNGSQTKEIPQENPQNEQAK